MAGFDVTAGELYAAGAALDEISQPHSISFARSRRRGKHWRALCRFGPTSIASTGRTPRRSRTMRRS